MSNIEINVNGFQCHCDRETVLNLSPVIRQYFEKNPNTTSYYAGFKDIPSNFDSKCLDKVISGKPFSIDSGDIPSYSFIANNLKIAPLQSAISSFAGKTQHGEPQQYNFSY